MLTVHVCQPRGRICHAAPVLVGYAHTCVGSPQTHNMQHTGQGGDGGLIVFYVYFDDFFWFVFILATEQTQSTHERLSNTINNTTYNNKNTTR